MRAEVRCRTATRTGAEDHNIDTKRTHARSLRVRRHRCHTCGVSGQGARVEHCGVLGGSLKGREGVISQRNLRVACGAEDAKLEANAMSKVAATARRIGFAERLAGRRPRGKVSPCDVEGV